jgi:hypothetical protein
MHMKNNLFQRPPIQWILLGLAFGLLACGQFQIGLEGSATPEQNLPATIAALQTEKARLAAQLQQATVMLTETVTATPLPTPTPSTTFTPSPTALPVTPSPDIEAGDAALPTPLSPTPILTPSPDGAVSQASPPPAPATPSPPVDSEWIVRNFLVFPGESGRLYVLQQQTGPSPQIRLLISDDFGQSWVAFPGPLPFDAACLRNLNLDYATLDALYASTCQGLYRWSGAEWVFVSPQKTEMVAIVYSQPNQLWATAPPGPSDNPVLYSDNGGETWTPASRFLSHANGVAILAFDPQNTNILYATIWPEYSGSYLRRSVANGQWEILPTPHNNAAISVGFAIDGNSGALYVVSEGEGSQLWRSPNPAVADVNTIQWKFVYDFGSGVQAQLLASGWSPEGVALYANLTQAGQPILSRSLDGGQTWAPLPIEF